MPNGQPYIDINNKAEKPAESARNWASIIEELLKSSGYSLCEIRNLKDKLKRDEVLREIKEKSSISVRELARVLGISKDIIFRA